MRDNWDGVVLKDKYAFCGLNSICLYKYMGSLQVAGGPIMDDIDKGTKRARHSKIFGYRNCVCESRLVRFWHFLGNGKLEENDSFVMNDNLNSLNR